MTSIGTTSKGDFSIDLTKHTNVEGMSGMGKTSLLQNLFLGWVRSGGGGLFIDPHGDAADYIASHFPKTRVQDFIWFDPDRSSVPPLNPLYFKNAKELEMGKETLFSTVKSLAGSAWGDESARVTVNAIDAVCKRFEHPTPVHVFRFMVDDGFRTKVLDASKDPLLRFFQKQYDEKLRDSEQMSKFSPAINKFAKFLRPNIMPVIGQETSLDFLDIMNTSKVLVCRFSKGRLGEEVAQLLYSFVVSMVSIAALRREKQKERPHFLCVFDEVQNGIHGGRFASLLAEGRKYGISTVNATQGMYQLPFAKDLFSNCPTQIAYNVSGEDAKAIADSWRYVNFKGQALLPEHITALPRYEFWARTFDAHNEPVVERVRCHPPLKRQGDEMAKEELVKQSLMRYSNWKKDVAAKVLKDLS
jgi:hypothetical protein